MLPEWEDPAQVTIDTKMLNGCTVVLLPFLLFCSPLLTAGALLLLALVWLALRALQLDSVSNVAYVVCGFLLLIPYSRIDPAYANPIFLPSASMILLNAGSWAGRLVCGDAKLVDKRNKDKREAAEDE